MAGERILHEARLYAPQPMNALIVGTNKQTILDFLPETFLMIDDGELLDQISFPKRKIVLHFDISKHTFNPLKNIDYKKARDFVNVLNAVFPEGESTLPRKNSTFVLLKALLDKPTFLDKLITQSKDTEDAYQKIQTLLLSPVLERVLNTRLSFTLSGTILVRLDRAELGDFDCFVLGNLLISQYQGAVVIPDFGFYAHPGYRTLIRQNRLIAGVNSFDELPDFKSQLLTIEQKIGSHCTSDDADALALYAGKWRGTLDFSDYVAKCIA